MLALPTASLPANEPINMASRRSTGSCLYGDSERQSRVFQPQPCLGSGSFQVRPEVFEAPDIRARREGSGHDAFHNLSCSRSLRQQSAGACAGVASCTDVDALNQEQRSELKPHPRRPSPSQFQRECSRGYLVAASEWRARSAPCRRLVMWTSGAGMHVACVLHHRSRRGRRRA